MKPNPTKFFTHYDGDKNRGQVGCIYFLCDISFSQLCEKRWPTLGRKTIQSTRRVLAQYYWATRSFICSFARSTYLFAFTAMLASLARCAADIRLFALLTHSLAPELKGNGVENSWMLGHTVLSITLLWARASEWSITDVSVLGGSEPFPFLCEKARRRPSERFPF